MDNQQLKLNNQICFPIYSVSRLITKAYKPFLEEMGLTYPQYLVLLVLWENDNIAMNKIGEKLLLNTNTLSPLIKRMEKMDLLQRKRSNKDERSVFIQLTEKGKKLKNTAIPIPEKLLNTLLTEDVTLTEIMLLKDTLNKWSDILLDRQNDK
ncbi:MULTISPECIES: MarR family winged helix-turn-helix transcriptional regulator [unclassified Salegentibacter]|uniref:MarR family winged helix-turn-helix transcriptional regulator n=1 Tax=unclassified Salegentibacter TaxID=2633436 RepID=UPI00094A4EB6|nr:MULTISPECIES: MarR family transcriptional regulator [unclassified Salegentibacter]APS38618.1 MarR family transcriptional regulator [Salegentibacter sp. T436]MBO2544075.1 MarR family transcriptional regulator [Salegentibacter sp. BDJ18]|tara:strand:- start:1440 stop:1895 length:456 start_codon:yes stop_codon:yes gene_type:complete